MIRALKRAFASDRSSGVVVECRRCGASLAADATECHECGGDEIVTYRF